MSICVGINPAVGRIKCYYLKTKERSGHKITPVRENDKEKISLMYDEIKTKLDGKPGFACVVVGFWVSNEMRKNFIEIGKSKGFKDIQTLHGCVINFFTVMFEKWENQEENDDDIVGVIMKDCIHVWERNKSKMMVNRIFYSLEDAFADGKLLSINYSDIIKSYNPRLIINGALMKAMIMSKNPRFKRFDALSMSEWTYTILRDSRTEIDLCEKYEVLPFRKVIDFQKEKNEKVFKVKRGRKYFEVELPETDIRKIEFNLDINGIHSFKFYETVKPSFTDNLVQDYDKEQSSSIEKIDPVDDDEEEQSSSIDETDSTQVNHYKTSFSINGSASEQGKEELSSINETDFEPAHKKDKPTFIEDSIQIDYKEKPTLIDEIDPNQVKDALEKLPKFFKFPKTSYAYNPNVVGIDLGTTRCCVAVARPNKIETVAFDNSSRLLPSFVSYCETNPICGYVAASRMRNYCKTTVFDVKRIIGKRYNELKLNRIWPFEIRDAGSTPLIRTESKTGPLFVSPQQVSAELLKYIKFKAEEFQGQTLSHAVITVPAAFTYSQKRDTIKAALLAGWQNVDILPEPVAATFAYYVDRPIPNNTTILLFDLGGGTLDTCIFKTVDNRLQIISGRGNLYIGGRDFDDLLINHIVQKLRDDFHVTNLGNKIYNIMDKCIQMKEFLSTTTEAIFDVDAYGQEGYITITRQELEYLSKDLLEKIGNTVNKVLKDANMKHSDIQKVMLVGGGCRMPIVKKLLLGMFPKADHWCQENVDEVVAIGAAYYSYHLLHTNSNSKCNII